MRRSGTIPGEVAERLETVYGTREAGAEGGHRLVSVIFLVGALLIACGIIALVAWHWEEMSQTLKLLLLVSAMLGAHATGYLLWFHGNRPRLGHALVLLGTLIFFANIGLVAQIFHVSSDGRGAWLALAIGAATIVLALDSVPHLLVALVGAVSWVLFAPRGWSIEYADAMAPWFVPVLIAVAGLTTRIVRRTGSSIALAAGWVAGTIVAGRFFDQLLPHGHGETLFHAITLASGAAAAGLATRLSPDPVSPPNDRSISLASTLEFLAAAFIAIGAFFGGFLDVHRTFLAQDWISWATAMAFTLVALALAARGPRGIDLGTFRARIAFCAFIAICGAPHPVAAALLANVALLVTGFSLGVSGVQDEHRGRFWFGTLLVVATILARFFEYDTNLWLKAAAFIGCGAAVLLAGVLYERRLAPARMTRTPGNAS